MKPFLPLQWTPRRDALSPHILAVNGAQRAALARWLLEQPDARLRHYQAIYDNEWFLLFSDKDELPWLDGGHWLAPEPEQPGLLLPTSQTLLPSVALAHDALRQQLKPSGQLAIMQHNNQMLCFDLQPMAAIHRDTLALWLGQLLATTSKTQEHSP